MPQVPVNFLAILGCGVASMILGSIWYGPLFGKQWMHLMGFSKEKSEQMKNHPMVKAYVLMFIGSLVMAYVLQHSLVFASAYLNVAGVSAGLMAGFWSWLGFIAPVTLGAVLWEGRSWKLWFLLNGYQLTLLLIMGAILAAWK